MQTTKLLHCQEDDQNMLNVTQSIFRSKFLHSLRISGFDNIEFSAKKVRKNNKIVYVFHLPCKQPKSRRCRNHVECDPVNFPFQVYLFPRQQISLLSKEMTKPLTKKLLNKPQKSEMNTLYRYMRNED